MARTKVSLPGDARPRVVTVSIGARGDTIVVHLRGEHDCSTVPALAATLASAVALDNTNLVVDMSEVQFISAATVRVLTAAADFLKEQGRSFALRSPSQCTRRILDLCGVSDIYEPEGT